MPSGNPNRGGGGGKDLPPLRDAINNREGYGTNSVDRRALDRAADTLPKPNSTNRKGKKNDFKNSLDRTTGAEVLEPRDSSSYSSPKYSSSTAGYDKYAKDKKSGGSGSHH
ncbi:hypothetical protein PGQ11_009824 [Apiospora arundinis]|uniref:Uncharacterized protein n=1 Tax=Apiospora arundinis TaxID=335852 RepID=A0ABR2I7X6_9PEZI